jgi:hypothetical protein
MFLVPEVLWGLVNTFFLKVSLLPAIKSNGLNQLIAVIQFFGIFLTFVFCLLFYRPKNILLKIAIVLILGCLVLLLAYILVFMFNFNPQIG